jgi:lipoprotein-anchoring transpeptidase ErfK/SrfK
MKRWTRLAAATLAVFALIAPVAAEEAATLLKAPRTTTPETTMVVAESFAGSIFQRFRNKRSTTTAAASQFERQMVSIESQQPAGTIIVDTGKHFLYLILGDGQAMRYGIGVARDGFEWAGTHRITNKKEWPTWTPPAEMRKRVPGLPRSMPGGVDNPLGARALYIGSTLYRIHGTNEPWSIGQNVSSGCIRMLNDDVIDLYERVRVGARVIVM